MSILYSTIRTLILDKAINALFDNVVTAFSKFDLLNGIRFFEEIHVEELPDFSGLPSTNIYYDCVIEVVEYCDPKNINVLFTSEKVCTSMGISKRPLFYRLVSRTKVTFISDKILKLSKIK